MAESFFATLEKGLLNRRRFRTQAEAKTAVFVWIPGCLSEFGNTDTRDASLNASPAFRQRLEKNRIR